MDCRCAAGHRWLRELGLVVIADQLALELIAGRFVGFAGANSQNFKMRGLHLFVRNDHDANLMALLQFDDGAALFGGGGHALAAGVRMRGPLEEAEQKIFAAIDEAIQTLPPAGIR